MSQLGKGEERSAEGRSIENDLSIGATNARSHSDGLILQEAFIQALKMGIEEAFSRDGLPLPLQYGQYQKAFQPSILAFVSESGKRDFCCLIKSI